MGEPIEKDEFLIHMDFLRSQLRDVIERLEVQNGRVRKGEVDIAVLKDRSPGRVAVTWGIPATDPVVIAQVNAFLVQLLPQLSLDAGFPITMPPVTP